MAEEGGGAGGTVPRTLCFHFSICRGQGDPRPRTTGQVALTGSALDRRRGGGCPELRGLSLKPEQLVNGLTSMAIGHGTSVEMVVCSSVSSYDVRRTLSILTQTLDSPGCPAAPCRAGISSLLACLWHQSSGDGDGDDTRVIRDACQRACVRPDVNYMYVGPGSSLPSYMYILLIGCFFRVSDGERAGPLLLLLATGTHWTRGWLRCCPR
jgi:hypothetical protein